MPSARASELDVCVPSVHPCPQRIEGGVRLIGTLEVMRAVLLHAGDRGGIAVDVCEARLARQLIQPVPKAQKRVSVEGERMAWQEGREWIAGTKCAMDVGHHQPGRRCIAAELLLHTSDDKAGRRRDGHTRSST